MARVFEIPKPSPAMTIFVRRDTLSWVIQLVLIVPALVALLPLFAAVAIAIKLTSPGPVLYRGARVGRGGRIFRIYKFRTLVQGAEQRIGARLLQADDLDAYTPIGRFLKKSKFDELPQLFNVLRGEMRLVGPRPVRPVFLEQFVQEIPNYARRFTVAPGITGIAQLRGGYYTLPLHKLRYDLIYIANRSVLLDLKLVALTFVKVLDRWLSTGLFVSVLFLFASFAPSGFESLPAISIGRYRIDVLHLILILTAVGVFLKRRPSQFSLYRCPLNLPLLVVLGLNAVWTLVPFGQAGPGPGNYMLTGLLLAFLIVNTLTRDDFTTLTLRVVALTSVFMSLLGLAEIFLLNYADGPPGPKDLARASSLLGSPVVLSVYLVLGMPLLFAEVRKATSQRAREFWLVCSTVSVIGIFLTQTRVGLVAMLVSGMVVLVRRRSQALAFGALVVLICCVLVAVGPSRFGPGRISEDVAEWFRETGEVVAGLSPKDWLVGVGASEAWPAAAIAREKPGKVRAGERWSSGNMHVTLALEQGLLGWLIVIGIVVAAVRGLKRTQDHIKDERSRAMVRALMASIIGFLVSMNVMDTFHSPPIHIFFWSLIGIALGIVVQRRRRRGNLIWRFGDSGD